MILYKIMPTTAITILSSKKMLMLSINARNTPNGMLYAPMKGKAIKVNETK